MSRFLNLHRPDPYRLFEAVLRRSRLGIRAAYDAAFAADLRCKELMQEERFLGARGQPFGFPLFGGDVDAGRFITPEVVERRAALWAEAQAEDLQTDFQASVVVLWADDTLRRFERSVLKARGESDKRVRSDLRSGRCLDDAAARRDEHVATRVRLGRRSGHRVSLRPADGDHEGCETSIQHHRGPSARVRHRKTRTDS